LVRHSDSVIRHSLTAPVDRRDIGEAARLALELDGLGFEVFYVLGTPEALERADVAYTRDRLGWRPTHDFAGLPRD